MTDLDERLRDALPALADQMLTTGVPSSGGGAGESPGAMHGLRPVLLLVATVAIAVLGGIALRQPAGEIAIQTSSQAWRVVGLESELLTLYSKSMEPTIPSGSPVRMYVLDESVVLERGDLVVVPSGNDGVELIRRVIGLPGESGGSFPPLEIGGEWILQPGAQNGDRSSVTGASPNGERGSRIDFGYVLMADNQGLDDDSDWLRVAHDSIRLWAPGDTTAVPPLLPSERAEQIAGLTRCLEETSLELADVRLESKDVFAHVAQQMNTQDVDEETARRLFECTMEFALLARE